MSEQLSGEKYLKIAGKYGMATANLIFYFLEKKQESLGGVVPQAKTKERKKRKKFRRKRGKK